MNDLEEFVVALAEGHSVLYREDQIDRNGLVMHPNQSYGLVFHRDPTGRMIVTSVFLNRPTPRPSLLGLERSPSNQAQNQFLFQNWKWLCDSQHDLFTQLEGCAKGFVLGLKKDFTDHYPFGGKRSDDDPPAVNRDHLSIHFSVTEQSMHGLASQNINEIGQHLFGFHLDDDFALVKLNSLEGAFPQSAIKFVVQMALQQESVFHGHLIAIGRGNNSA